MPADQKRHSQTVKDCDTSFRRSEVTRLEGCLVLTINRYRETGNSMTSDRLMQYSAELSNVSKGPWEKAICQRLVDIRKETQVALAAAGLNKRRNIMRHRRNNVSDNEEKKEKQTKEKSDQTNEGAV